MITINTIANIYDYLTDINIIEINDYISKTIKILDYDIRTTYLTLRNFYNNKKNLLYIYNYDKKSSLITLNIININNLNDIQIYILQNKKTTNYYNLLTGKTIKYSGRNSYNSDGPIYNSDRTITVINKSLTKYKHNKRDNNYFIEKKLYDNIWYQKYYFEGKLKKINLILLGINYNYYLYNYNNYIYIYYYKKFIYSYKRIHININIVNLIMIGYTIKNMFIII